MEHLEDLSAPLRLQMKYDTQFLIFHLTLHIRLWPSKTLETMQLTVYDVVSPFCQRSKCPNNTEGPGLP